MNRHFIYLLDEMGLDSDLYDSREEVGVVHIDDQLLLIA